jgi:hypothetical protein
LNSRRSHPSIKRKINFYNIIEYQYVHIHSYHPYHYHHPIRLRGTNIVYTTRTVLFGYIFTTDWFIRASSLFFPLDAITCTSLKSILYSG